MPESIASMVSAIVIQIEDRHKRGEVVIKRDLKILQKQLRIAEKIKDIILQADIHQLMGVLMATYTDDAREVPQHFIRARELYELQNLAKKVAQSMMRLATWYGFAGEYEKKISLTEEAARIAHEERDAGLETHCLTNLGATYIALNNYSTALEKYRQASEILKSTTINRRGSLILQIEYGLANSYFHLNQPDNAWKYAERCYNLSKEYGNPKYQIRSAGLLARVLMKYPRQPARSPLDYLKEGYALIESSGQKLEKPPLLEIEADYLKQSGQPAREKYAEAIAAYEAVNRPGEAETLRQRLANEASET